jgi:hypothetical protein
MSDLGDLRAGMKALLLRVSTIRFVNDYPPKSISKNGYAFIDLISAALTFGGRPEIHLFTVPIKVVVNYNAEIDDVAVTEPVIDAILAEIRLDQTLGAFNASRVEPISFSQGIIDLGEGLPSYVGFEMTVEVKKTYNLSIS